MLQVIGGAPLHISESSILTEVAQSAAGHGGGLRNDSDGTSAVSGGRAQFRGFLRGVNQIVHRMHGIPLVSEERLDSIAARLASSAGYALDGGDWTHHSVRVDAGSVFSGELTDRSGMLHKPRSKKRALSELMPSRSVSATAERFESRRIELEGQITHYKPGTTQVGNAGSRASGKRRDIHTFVTSTQMDWLAMLQGSQSALDQAANDAYAVRELFADFTEELLAKGIGDAASLWGLQDMPVPRLTLTEDYTSAVALDAIFNDFAGLIGRVQDANNDRGDAPNTLIMGNRLARRLIPANNITAGGSLTGADLRQKLASLFDETGIERFVMAPSLKGFAGQANDDAAVLCRFDGEAGLHQVPAMTGAPVRSASTLTGDQTLWAMRHGGLDINDATACAIITATVAS